MLVAYLKSGETDCSQCDSDTTRCVTFVYFLAVEGRESRKGKKNNNDHRALHGANRVDTNTALAADTHRTTHEELLEEEETTTTCTASDVVA